MSAAVTPAGRLLAMLEEERSLETRPLGEILADLDAHGIDAAGPIKLARRLSENHAGPATALLGAVIEDEAVEAEIAALEAAPIDDVRGRLDVGTVAAVAAEAKRRGGASSNVVGLRRRKSVAWAWAGSLVGMAACALIVVAAWWPPSDLMSSDPEFATVEVRPARPEASTAAAPAALEAAPPELETRLSNPDGQASARMVLSAESAENEADGAVDVPEAVPVPPASEERSQAPGIASRMAEPAESLASPPETGASAPAAILSREPPAPAIADSAPESADGPQPEVLSEAAAPPLPPRPPVRPEVLSEAAAPPLPPLPPMRPEDSRTLADDALSGTAIGNAAPSQPAPPPDWIGQLAIPQGRNDGSARGLVLGLGGENDSGDPVLKDAGSIAIVVDGVVFPGILEAGAGTAWADGAIPELSPDQIATALSPRAGLLTDPSGSGPAEIGSRARGQQAGAVPIEPGAAGGSAYWQDSPDGDPLSLAPGLANGLEAMLRDARAIGADPWTGQVADRIMDARVVANSLTILALLKIRAAGIDADAVLLPREFGASAADDPLLPLLGYWFGDDAARFRLIILPPR